MSRLKMMGRASGLVLTATALMVGTAGTSSAAAAAVTRTASCSTTGASGSSTTVSGSDPYGEVKVTLRVKDTLADGHHVRVRFLSKTSGGVKVTWQWRSNTDGNGTTKVWETTAQTTYGIYEKGVEVARFEGSTLLNSCTDWG
ncbi:hypothetical protein [Streptomyces sp. NPDC091212]|uniref:hypothetical protein n=1 Tax=Streptomyces sp. NPDC091212 TaxID=3155191 RepID=UPI00341AFB0A